MKVQNKKIPKVLYKKIYANVPILCVEAVAVDRMNNFLLIRRKYPPEAGEWWFPGGRLYKFEDFGDAAVRCLQKETGLIGTFVRKLGIQNYMTSQGHFPGLGCHTPVVASLVRVNRKDTVQINEESIEYAWFSTVDRRWKIHLKYYLKLAGIT